MIKISIGNKQYKVREAKTQEERSKGLQKIEKLQEDEGMLFYFDPPQKVSMWMSDTIIPLDIIFINDDQEVIKVYQGIPMDKTLFTSEDVAYVLEVNANSGIEVGDELEFEDEAPVMKVLFPDGSEQMALYGGERIVSRRETRILIKKAKKAQQSQLEKDYKALGRYIFKVIEKQDNREPEYVAAPT